MAQTHTLQQIQMLVDQVRLTIMSEQFDATPETKTLAREYAELSRQLNHRLRQCGEFLRQGLRSEAIREAESEPRLLEAVGVVDSLSEEEQKAWSDVCEFLELPRPEPMLNDAALMLDSAYEEHGPLEKLLRLHRRLALQRAPLSKRLAILRNLAVDDPTTEFWEEDILEYEKARHVQMFEELRKLKRSPSAAALSELRDEIDGAQWQTPVPRKVQVLVRELQQTARRDEARQALQEAETILQVAFAEMNFARARSAYAQWQENWPAAELADDDPLAIAAIPALSWCEQSAAREAEEADWNRTLAKAESLLERNDADLLALERMSDELDRFERPVPKTIDNRLQSRIASLNLRRRRHRLLVITGSSLATIAVVSLVTVVVLQANERSFRGDVLARIDRFVTQGEVEPATALLTKFTGRWEGSPEWLDAVNAVNELQSTIDERSRRLDTTLQEASAVPDNDEKTFREIRGRAQTIIEEQPVIQQLVDRMELSFRNLSSERGLRLKEREAALFQRLEAQSNQLDQLNARVAELEERTFETQIQRLKDALRIIEQEAAGMNPQIRDQSQLLMTQANELTGEVYRQIRRKKLLAEMADASRESFAGTRLMTDLYGELLGQLQMVTKEENALKELERVVQEKSAWAAIEEYRRRFSEPAEKLFPTSADQIAERSQDVADYLKSYPQSPLLGPVKDYAAVLAILEKRHGNSGSLVERVRLAAIDDFAMKNLYAVRVKNLDWPYYITDSRTFTEKQIVEISGYRQDRQPQLVRFSASQLVNRDAEPAPQQELAETLSSQLDQLEFNNWETTFRDMTQAVLEAKTVDPILRLRLLMILQMQAKEGSLTLPTHQPFVAYTSEQTGVSQQVNLLTQWPDPEDADVLQRRKKAEEYVDKLRVTEALKDVWKSSEDRFTSLAEILNRPYRAIGWMTRDDDGEPVLDIDVPPAGTWNLAICRLGETDGAEAVLRQIGHARNGEAVVPDDSLKYEFCPCRLVFAYPSP
ncbi:hypothetical protein [Rubinisphaera margarita]|uniref:hypothetical protein n=1 Tax=Rubinisphaera margarita TaxID=2909586 RepID=UPI001EE8A3A9|nr:hypothetical protein [Rubinisphaera margarita]MCG6155885.1 hypothetical protein [Rubinisphaera margarita]